MSLRIPLTVQRCPGAAKGKVRFCEAGKCLIAEQVVLRRWRARSQTARARGRGETFDGCRLPPNTWNLVLDCRHHGLSERDLVNPDALQAAIAAARVRHPTWRAPHAAKLAPLLRFLLGRRVLTAVLERERDAANPGLPDLFLWRRTPERPVHGGRFVEVKRRLLRPAWRERLSLAQRAELQFLRSLGLKAGVVYLIETGARTSPGSPQA